MLHGSDSDIVWLQRDFGIYVANLFDTGQAARVLGYPSAGLAYLLSRFCKIKVGLPCLGSTQPCRWTAHVAGARHCPALQTGQHLPSAYWTHCACRSPDSNDRAADVRKSIAAVVQS